MMNPRTQAYLRTKVMSASPVELRLMLVDGAIRFAEQCRGGLEQKNFEQAYEGSRQCRAILTELLSGLKPDQDPLLCQRLNSLYTFLISRMMEAMSERDPEPILGVIELLLRPGPRESSETIPRWSADDFISQVESPFMPEAGSDRNGFF